MAADPTSLDDRGTGGAADSGKLTEAPALSEAAAAGGDSAAAAAPPGLGGLTHLDAHGAVHQVDVTHKSATSREAEAEAIVVLPIRAWEALTTATLAKGDAIASVRLAGIMGAKLTPTLIPLCHSVPLGGVTIDVEFDAEHLSVRIVATARTHAPTGVEMEAMTAASVAALTLYDMVKGVDKGVLIRSVRLLRKTGGKSGDWRAGGPTPAAGS